MKVNILLGLLTGLVCSCSTSKVVNSNDLTGSFYAAYGDVKGVKGTSTKYYLDLNSDNVFYFEIKGHGWNNPQCTGRWEQKGNILYLKCNEEKDLGVMLSSDYMNQREYTIKIQSKDKLKYGKIVLRRK